jgi:hypothetical protein
LLPNDDRPGGDPVVVLSHALWQSRFAQDPAVVGRKVILDGEPFVIAGVMPADSLPAWASARDLRRCSALAGLANR